MIGRTDQDVFSPRAAEAVATLLEIDQRASALSLALLLSLAAHDPEELDRRATKYAVVRYQHREFPFMPADFEGLEPKGEGPARIRPKRRAGHSTDGSPEPFTPIADPMRYGLIDETSGEASGRLPEPLGGGKLKPPATEDGLGDENGTDGHRPPPAPKQRYANTDIEAAARPFIEEYELSTRSCTVVRQGNNVGADFVASDGRYIEVKAFSGDAPDSFDLESPEWRAAQHPDVAGRYWVYVVEHLGDGHPPKITAIFNPVVDEATRKEPTGKLRVRGWRNAHTQRVARFGERQPSRGRP